MQAVNTGGLSLACHYRSYRRVVLYRQLTKAEMQTVPCRKFWQDCNLTGWGYDVLKTFVMLIISLAVR